MWLGDRGWERVRRRMCLRSLALTMTSNMQTNSACVIYRRRRCVYPCDGICRGPSHSQQVRLADQDCIESDFCDAMIFFPLLDFLSGIQSLALDLLQASRCTTHSTILSSVPWP